MTGVKWLYITTEGKVIHVSQPKDSKFKAIKELAQQEVLRALLYYQTTERKPSHLQLIQFDRITLGTDGAYDERNKENKTQSFDYSFFCATPESLAERKGPLPLPLVPTIPSSEEIKYLYEYLDKKIPLLKETAPIIVEMTIGRAQRIYQEQINLVNKASELRIRTRQNKN
ncbi:hypothetical protein [Psychrobacillus sp. FSL K6-1464]|uniref:hypothetical protein n=1 Tax=Psychrobacillus sp. FSL K6-1464 TaxID=2921545 RepID=UPI0030F6CA2D